LATKFKSAKADGKGERKLLPLAPVILRIGEMQNKAIKQPLKSVAVASSPPNPSIPPSLLDQTIINEGNMGGKWELRWKLEEVLSAAESPSSFVSSNQQSQPIWRRQSGKVPSERSKRRRIWNGMNGACCPCEGHLHECGQRPGGMAD
jgi:hypothetical protein